VTPSPPPAPGDTSNAVLPSATTARSATDHTATSPVFVQAAWRILSPVETVARRFHTAEALVHTPPAASTAHATKVERATAGLVGLHIGHKPAGASGWICSTFEHVDNFPTLDEPADRAAYNSHNKSRRETPRPPDAEAGSPGAPPLNTAITEPVSRRPHIVRQIPVAPPPPVHSTPPTMPRCAP
jgi:hypothetical protein